MNNDQKIMEWIKKSQDKNAKPILVIHGHTCTGKTRTIERLFSKRNSFYMPCHTFEKRSKVLSYLSRVVCISAIENMIQKSSRDFLIFDSFQYPDMIARDLTNVVVQHTAKFVIVLDGDYRSKIYSFGNMVEDIYFSQMSNGNESDNKDIVMQLLDSTVPYKDRLRMYDDSMFPVILENTPINLKHHYLSADISDIPYAKALLNGIHEKINISTLKYTQPVARSEYFVLNECEAIDKCIHKKF